MKLLAVLGAGLLFLVLGVATVVHGQEPKGEEGKPAPHPAARPETAAPAPRHEAAPPRSEPRPQAEPAAHPPSPTPHEQRPPEIHPRQEPAAHPVAPNPHEARPPQDREDQDREHHEAIAPRPEAHSPERQHRTAAPEPAPAPRPQQPARSAAEPPRTAEQRRPAPTPEQERDWDRHRADNWQAEHHSWHERGGYRGYRIPEQRYQTYFGQPHVFRIYEYPVAFYNGYPRFQYGDYWVQVVDPWPNYWAPNWFYTDPVYVAYLNDGYYLINTLYPDVPLAVEIFGY